MSANHTKEVFSELYSRGAHFVLARNNPQDPKKHKSASQANWQTRKPHLEKVLGHTGYMAVIPASLGLVVVDVDYDKLHKPGDKPNTASNRLVETIRKVEAALGKALAKVQTQGGGFHLFYKGTHEERNGKWLYGDIRGAKGYVVIYDAPEVLRALKAADECEAVDTGVLVRRYPVAKAVKQRKRKQGPTPELLIELKEGEGGGRNNYLNEGVYTDSKYDVLTPELEEEWRAAGITSGLSPDEVNGTIESAKRAGEKDRSPFVLNRDHTVKVNNSHNIELALTRFGASLRLNEFSQKVILTYKDGTESPYSERDRRKLTIGIEKSSGFNVQKDYFRDAVHWLADTHAYHPVKEYLEALTWDGKPRIARMLEYYFGAADSPYTRAVSRIFLIAAVRRIYVPGAKFDEMPVLEGDTGTGKSTGVMLLCPKREWFSDDLPLDVNAKETIENTSGKWIIEASELSGMHPSTVKKLKSWLSRSYDGPARMAYAHEPEERSRQFVVIGTTNDGVYLDDPTGNRRYWPVLTTTVRNEEIESDRDQLWAEAYLELTKGVPIRLSSNLYHAAGVQQERRRTVDPWQALIANYIGTVQQDECIEEEDLWGAVGVEPNKRTTRDSTRINSIMRSLPYKRTTKRLTVGFGRHWVPTHDDCGSVASPECQGATDLPQDKL